MKKCIMLALGVAFLACCVGCAGLDLDAGNIKIEKIRAIPPDGLNYVPGDHPIIPSLAADVKVDASEIDFQGIQLEGELTGTLLLNAKELER